MNGKMVRIGNVIRRAFRRVFSLEALIKTFKQLTYKQVIFYSLILLSVIISLVFVYNNYAFYDRPIAKVIKSHTEETTDVTNQYGNEDTITIQNITAELKNGEQKKERIQLTNEYSITGAYDQSLETGNELFVSIDKDSVGEKQLTGSITDIKRDKYIVVTAWIFILVLLLVGKRQGLFASVSLAINLIILSYALDLNVKTGMNLLWIAAVTVILFTVISLLLVNGFNEKTYAAIIATLLGTFSSLLITFIVMTITSDNGLHYEEMQFLTRPYRLVFLAGLFIGSLGAVMDVAITMSSAIFELYEKNNHISVKALKTSALDIGKDIMGTMTNILFFAYISGSMPMLILYLKNYSPLGFTLSMNLSLELARALAGGIGIVLTIPIGLYISIFFVNRKRAKL